jgi:hypothetical protein
VLGREVEGPGGKPFSTYRLVRTTPEPTRQGEQAEGGNAPTEGAPIDPIEAAVQSGSDDLIAAFKGIRCPPAGGTGGPKEDKGNGGNALKVVGLAPAGSRCCLCGKGRKVHLIRQQGKREVDQAHLACAEKAWGNPQSPVTNAGDEDGLPDAGLQQGQAEEALPSHESHESHASQLGP